MNRRSASLLIPLLAVFALFYPASNREGSLRSEQTTRSAPDNTPKAKTTAEHEWDRGRTAVRRFLSQKKLAAPESKIEDPLHLRANTALHFMIVTVPDPIDSGLSQAFDRYVASIESAVQTHPYYLWSFDLPWKDCLAEKKSNKEASAPTQETNQGGSPQDDQSESTDSCRDRRYAKEPGYLLFNSPTYITKDEIESDAKGGTKKDDQKDAPKDAHEKGSIDLLLVYLVGETPTSGIQKRALKAALSEIGSYCGWRKDGKDPYTQEQGPQSPTCKDGKIDILAPSYSGSAQSLDIALSTWLDSEDKNKHVHYIRMVSGSATAISTETDFYYIQNIIKDRSAEFSFSSMELPDNVSNEKFCQYLKEHYSSTTKLKVALLSEGNTAYGQNAKKATEGADAENSPPKQAATDRQKSENENKPAQNSPPRCWDDMEMDILPFPLHISQLRAASERLREAEEASNPQPQISSKALPLSQALEDVRTQRDIPPFSPANAVANEQILGNLLATISREGYRFVGITASDTRDTIFLAQEVHEHSPQAVLFTTGAELLFLHPEINPSLRGMLIVTSYPLINSNQLWSQPAHFGVRLQFPDDGSEGIYNATLALLADKNSKNNDGNIMEFSPPFINEATKACALYHDCGPEDKPDNPRFSSDPNKCDSSKVLRPPVWIMVVGKNRLWPVKADDVTCDQDVSKYTKSVEGRHVTPHGKKTWLQGMYRQGILIFIVGFAVFCCLFSLPLIQRARTSEYGAIAGLRKLLQWEWLDALLAKTVYAQYHRRAEVCLLAAASCLAIFLIVLLTAAIVPFLAMIRVDALHWCDHPVQTFVIVAMSVICCLGVAFIVLAVISLLNSLKKPLPAAVRITQSHTLFWLPITVTVPVGLCFALWLAGLWLYQVYDSYDDLRAAVFTSLRSLDFSSGVSPLLPLFLILITGFIWAISSFRRIRQLDSYTNDDDGLIFGSLQLREINKLQGQINRCLNCPSLALPGAIPLLCLAFASAAFLLVHLVRSLEENAFYLLLVVCALFVGIAISLGILRFVCIWKKARHILEHISVVPLRRACRRLRECHPSMPKVDLTARGGALAHLECSIAQARTFLIRASDPKSLGPAHAQKIAGNSDVQKALQNADEALEKARAADMENKWQEKLTQEANARIALDTISKALVGFLDDHWKEVRSPGESDSDQGPSNPLKIFQLAEDFLVSRIAQYLACIFPQMQNLIFNAVAGLLILLFAASCYPFQPQELFLYFSWAVILSAVIIAMWVFIQMNRDPVLSCLNGTKPGQISWDREFILRIVLYGVVPILALLGAQFPQSFGQMFSYFLPKEGMH